MVKVGDKFKYDGHEWEVTGIHTGRLAGISAMYRLKFWANGKYTVTSYRRYFPEKKVQGLEFIDDVD
jgi:hypothetical protein